MSGSHLTMTTWRAIPTKAAASGIAAALSWECSAAILNSLNSGRTPTKPALPVFPVKDPVGPGAIRDQKTGLEGSSEKLTRQVRRPRHELTRIIYFCGRSETRAAYNKFRSLRTPVIQRHSESS